MDVLITLLWIFIRPSLQKQGFHWQENLGLGTKIRESDEEKKLLTKSHVRNQYAKKLQMIQFLIS